MKPLPMFYERLPEIYRTRDAEQQPADALRAYLGALEVPFQALHGNIEQLYEDLFIDTCDEWVIPYLADLLGTTHLKGDAHTLRADVADTIALRRRKGTLGALERLAGNLTNWAARAVELRENLGWAQHLNHQRPDAGGTPPYAVPTLTRFEVPRGGTAPLRDPAALALLGTPFDNFAHTADFKPAVDGQRHINLPNLALFLWRLAAYTVPPALTLAKGVVDLGVQPAGRARFALRFDLHPLDLPLRLFNTSRPGFLRNAGLDGVISPLTEADAVNGPMLDARLTSDTPAGHPEAYVQVGFYNDSGPQPGGFVMGDVGLHLFLPQSLQPLLLPQAPDTEFRWRFRGDNLCAWEAGLRRPAGYGEIIIDPDIGRVLIGLGDAAQAALLAVPQGGGLRSRLFCSLTYGAVGPVGAHPVVLPPAPQPVPVELRTVGPFGAGLTLQAALANLDSGTQPVVVEIQDSGVHLLDIGAIAGTAVDGGFALRLSRSLTVRAAPGQRPVVLLRRPLGFRPVVAADASLNTPAVRLEGLYIDADTAFPANTALITRAAVARLELIHCTLAPGGHALRNGTRAPMRATLNLRNGYGFSLPAEEDAFVPTPDVILQHCITGALAVDERYRLDIEASIVDAGAGVAANASGTLAIGAATNPATAWGAPLQFQGLTCFGAVRVAEVGGEGGLFSQRFEVLDNQHGCIKHSWFGGPADRLPPNHFCLHRAGARLAFSSEWFNAPGYAQVRQDSDVRVRNGGPDDDTMGAFGFLLEAHKFSNLQIRLREFMPAGVRPLVVPVT